MQRRSQSSGLRTRKRSNNLPPEVDLALRTKNKLMLYTVAASSNTWPITREELLNLFFMGTGTNSARRILGSIRLKKVAVWAMGTFPTSQTTAIITSPDIKWLAQGPQTKYSRTMFAGQPTCLMSVPPEDSLARFWSMTGVNETEILFEVTAGTGSIIGLWVDYVIQNDDPSIATGLVTSSTATAGIVYYNNLGGAVATIQPQIGNPNYGT